MTAADLKAELDRLEVEVLEMRQTGILWRLSKRKILAAKEERIEWLKRELIAKAVTAPKPKAKPKKRSPFSRKKK